jgi:hypothetical protein
MSDEELINEFRRLVGLLIDRDGEKDAYPEGILRRVQHGVVTMTHYVSTYGDQSLLVNDGAVEVFLESSREYPDQTNYNLEWMRYMLPLLRRLTVLDQLAAISSKPVPDSPESSREPRG